jgi:hypothetical protein
LAPTLYARPIHRNTRHRLNKSGMISLEESPEHEPEIGPNGVRVAPAT